MTTYKQGDWNAVCALCGFEYKASELRWNSQIQDYVCKYDWENRHPQERLRAVHDDQSVAWSRPGPADSYSNDEFDYNLGIGTDNGDADKTFTGGVDNQIQYFKTALTANRTITLVGIEGDSFRIIRTGLGAFTLDVGGVQTIPASTAAIVDVYYHDAAWNLSNYELL